mmetsp:Transcript_17580/g.38061  ORF Transcript_17580/g.38061 Transcript_17580/m.38061 type:complete len:675 (+) Transcript_17580:154-2178(+)
MKFTAVVSAGLAAALSCRCYAFSPVARINSIAPSRLSSPSSLSAEDGNDAASSSALLDPPKSEAVAAGYSSAADAGKSLTQRIMERTSSSAQAGGAGGASTWDAFQRAESNWSRLKSSRAFDYDATRIDNPGVPPPQLFVTDDGAAGNPKCWARLRSSSESKSDLDYDVTICGGTLGIFIAMALQLKGVRVAVVEAGKLMGREQEWNISLKELEELVEMGVLTNEDLEEAITTEFPGCRAGFKNSEVTPLEGSYFDNEIGYECFTPGVLNLGISPSILIANVAKRFQAAGGTVLERSPLKGIVVSESMGAALDMGEDAEPITARLVLDCMGNASPVSRQQRHGLKPDGVCAVVGSCAGGYDKESNLIGDIIYTNTEIQDKGTNGQLQYFWEAFPVGIGRKGKEPGSSDVKTTYMFTYMDASEDRPSLTTLMDDYWEQLPIYQPSISDVERDLDVKRVLFAYFPTFTDSPLKPQWRRLLAVGDASGIQSPLSFGGFGALTRHLDRISSAIAEAVEHDLLHKSDLGAINAYTPNLSAAWMFQKAMSARVGKKVNPKFVNRLLATNFDVMNDMGPRTMMPFLQDVVRIDGLAGSLARSFVADPMFMPEIVAHVGIPTLADWLGHVAMIATYNALHNVAAPIITPFVDKMEDSRERFLWRRRMDAWKFGSGNDYVFEE